MTAAVAGGARTPRPGQEKARALREEAARRQRRRRTALASAGLVVALLVALVVALALSRSGSAGAPAAAPAGTTERGGVLTGAPDAPVTVTVYLDLQCPACRAFEEQAGPWLEQQRAAGAVEVEVVPIAILDRLSSGTEYSTRAASAVHCVAADGADGGAGGGASRVPAFTAALYAEQPPEGGTGLPDDDLVQAAREAGASPEVEGCITGGTYRDLVAQTTETALASTGDGGGGVTGTPTVLVNGRAVEASLPALQAAVQAAAR